MVVHVRYNSWYISQICPEIQVNEINAPYDKHHKVSTFLRSHQNTHDYAKC